jgi:nucleotide-binding universal stress UspA family protein
MFRTIIVPLNGTEAAEAAVPIAAEEARHHSAQLVLLQVIPRPELPEDHVVHGGPLPVVYVEEERDCLHSRARRYLRSVVDRYRLGMKTVVSVEFGDPYLRLKAAIERYPSPLVVMATPAPGRDRLSTLPDALVGLLREGLTPVLVVRGSRSIRLLPEVPVAAGITQPLDDQVPQWEILTAVDPRVIGSN